MATIRTSEDFYNAVTKGKDVPRYGAEGGAILTGKKPVWSSGGGGGGGSSGGTSTPEPEPEKPAVGSSYEEASPGAKKAFDTMSRGEKLTPAEEVAIRQFVIRDEARKKGVNMGDLTEAGEKKFISGLVNESKVQKTAIVLPPEQSLGQIKELSLVGGGSDFFSTITSNKNVPVYGKAGADIITGNRAVSEVSPSELKSLPSSNNVFKETFIDVAPEPSLNKGGISKYELERGFVEKAKATGKDFFSLDIYRKAGRQFFLVEGSQLDVFETIAQPFQRFFPQTKGERMVTTTELRGTSFEGARGEIPLTPVTEFEFVQRETENRPEVLLPPAVRAQQISSSIETELKPIYQGKISAETTPEEFSLIEKEYQEVSQKEFEKRFGSAMESEQKLRGRISELGELRYDLGKPFKIAGIVALSATPLVGSAIGTEIIGADIAKGAMEKGIFGYGEPGLKPMERAKLIGAGAIEFGLALSSVGISRGVAEKEILKADVEEALIRQSLVDRPKPWDIGIRVEDSKNIIDITRFKGITEGAKAETLVIQRGERLADSGFGIKGTSTTVVEAQTYFDEIPIGQVIQREFTGSGTSVKGISVGNVEVGTRGILDTMITRKGTKTDIKLFADLQDIESIPIGGVGKKFISQEGKEYFVARSGEIKGFTVKLGFEGEDIVKSISLDIPETTTTVSRVFRSTIKSEETDGFKIFRPSGGKKTPMSSTFLQGNVLDSSVTKDVVSNKLAKLKFDFKPAQTPIGYGLPRMVGGLGLTEQQLQMSRGGLVSFPREKVMEFDIGIKPTKVNLVSFPDLNSKRIPIGISLFETPVSIKKGRSNIISGIGIASISSQGEKQAQKGLHQQSFSFEPFTVPPRRAPLDYNSRWRFGIPPIGFPKFGGGGSPKSLAPSMGREFVRTPSFGAVFKQFELGIKPMKVSKGLEMTGLFERPFTGKVEFGSLQSSRKKKKKRK